MLELEECILDKFLVLRDYFLLENIRFLGDMDDKSILETFGSCQLEIQLVSWLARKGRSWNERIANLIFIRLFLKIWKCSVF